MHLPSLSRNPACLMGYKNQFLKITTVIICSLYSPDSAWELLYFSGRQYPMFLSYSYLPEESFGLILEMFLNFFPSHF
jgi:hypothetical protein